MTDRIIMIEEKSIPAFAEQVARIVLAKIREEEKASSDPDPYLDARQLEQEVPAVKASTIKQQIRTGKYGKKMGARGKLVARASEVRRYNRL